ncbi:hypothetical protein LUZ61_014988 [Rhynchospora tenuis]|uniref:Remorin C-terminal domain-containing protein n=1 Tax=Rhynchospora tenuis TaxID=198213 RepID=A0AAD5Z3F7_9POAL|nr:hypothetical protein LUZ61_014988 [Rhynchospora tenuis]
MEYERIHKVQTVVISPSKLRMKLLGSSNSHNGARKKESSSKSVTASPSRLEELEISKNNLLAPDFVEEDMFKSEQYRTSKVGSATNTSNSEASRQEENSTNGSDNSNFEFQREERPGPQLMPAPLFRPMPSKWNDAEKWIMNRHSMHSNPIFSKKSPPPSSQNPNGVISNNNVRVAPELNASANRETAVTECGSVSGRKRGITRKKFSRLERNTNGASGTGTVQSVSMRDIGTEMTPIASQEQSMAGTPARPATPTFSPLSSIPSTPKRGPPSSSSSEATVDSRLWVQKKLRTVETPERELRIRTRQEIAALGLKLGKFNIASWASKEEVPEESECDNNFDEDESAKRVFAARAVAWEESQKSKLVSRYKREEVKIQAWEASQQAKFEAEKRRIEAHAEQMKLRVQEKTAKKISAMKQKVEGRKAKIEARKSRRVSRLAKEVDQIRRTGRAPTSCLRCCSWFSFGLLTK